MLALIGLSALSLMSWRGRLVRALGRAIASVVLLSLIASCSVQRSLKSDVRSQMSVTTRDTVREQVVVAVHDTLREVTTITVQLGQTGDTVKVAQVTERDRFRDRKAVKDKEEKLIIQKDTVYIEKRDSVSNTNLTNSTNEKKSSFLSILKWTFAILCAIIVLIITVKVCLRRSL